MSKLRPRFSGTDERGDDGLAHQRSLAAVITIVLSGCGGGGGGSDGGGGTGGTGNTGGAPNGGGAADTTPPTVSISQPAAGAVSGSVTISANASDNVGVVGVQFKLDGTAIGSEDTSSPYSVQWDAATASAGAHAMTAVARDAAGSTSPSAAVQVTVQGAAAWR